MINFKIKQIRQHKGISQEELANKVGLSRSYVSKIENNINNGSITLHTFISILEALEVEPSEVIDFCDRCKYKCNNK